MKIKICGITNPEDALDAVSLGVDAIGFIFAPSSKRYVSPDMAQAISIFLPPFVSVVGVFVNQSIDEIEQTIVRCQLDVVQLHGDESPQFCQGITRRVIKAFRVAQPEDLACIEYYQGFVSSFLLDTKVQNMDGGTGRIFDWGLALKAKEYQTPLILAGGINAQNLNKAFQMVNPYAVDLSSSVEASPGKKDYHKMQEIIGIAKSLVG